MFKPLLIAVVGLAVVAAAVFVGGKYWGRETTLSQQDTQRLTLEFTRTQIPNYQQTDFERQKVFDAISSPSDDKTAVIFGPETFKEPVALFVVDNKEIVGGFILEGALEHLAIRNVRWETEG